MKMKILTIIGITALISTSCCEQTGKEETKECCESKTKVNTIALAEGAIMHPEYVKNHWAHGLRMGWPIVNSHNRRVGITQAPEPGRLGGVVPVAPINRLCMLNDYVEPNQSFVACPNQDVVYGTLFGALNESPVVIQVPAFGCMRFMMPAPTNLVNLVRLIKRNRASAVLWTLILCMTFLSLKHSVGFINVGIWERRILIKKS
ncbi:MAG: DUF1254 domain-containing protein [Marinilabiliaceae bacterium]|nr:DUF1254 domain-containing protein [Marinilabiliaceae bacterium]